MNELLKKIRAKLVASSAATRAFYARNKLLVLGGLTMVSILLIVWARLGFTLDFNRFYAATNQEDCEAGGGIWDGGTANDPEFGVCLGYRDVAQQGPPPASACRYRSGGQQISCTHSQPRKEGGGKVSVDYALDASSAASLCQGNSDLRMGVYFGYSGQPESYPGFDLPKVQSPVSGGEYKLRGTATCTYTVAGRYIPFIRGGIEPVNGTGFDGNPVSGEAFEITQDDLGGTAGTDDGGGSTGGGSTGGGSTGGGSTGGGGAVTPPSPGILRLDSCANGTARLSWTPGANGNENLLRRIYTDNTNSWQELVNNAGTTSYTDTIPAGISYNYQVKSDPNTVSNTVTCANVTSAVIPPPGPNDPGAGMLVAPCTGGATPSITVRWSKSPPPGSAGPFNAGNPATLNRSVSGNTQQTNPPAADKGTYWEWVDTGVPIGASVLYRGKYGSDAGTNTVEFVASPANCGAATPIPTTLPVDDPVICAPAEQTVGVNQPARLTAIGGTDTYRWASDNQTEQGASATFTYATTGSKTVTVNSGASTADCRVVVQAAAAPAMTLTVLGRNVSSGGPEGLTVGALGEQQVEVVVRVRNSSADANLANILVRSALPQGLLYIAESTTVNNAAATVESITAGGLSIGSLGPSQEATVRFRARVNGASFPVGTTQASIVTQVSADGAGERSGSVVVSVSRAAVGVAPPAAVQTGPGDAVLVALLVSGIVTMLYVSYTHSPFFRRHEAEALSEDQGPMDFRG